MFLLDTNHCSYAILGNLQVLDRLNRIGDGEIAICTIVEGELFDMAARSQQRQTNMDLVRHFLEGLYIYPLDDTTAELYGTLKAAIFARYAPKDKAKRRRTKSYSTGDRRE